MKQFFGHRRTTTLFSLTALIVVGLTLSACGAGNSNDMGGMGGMNHGSSGMMMPTTDPKAPFDQQFIDMMVPHHMAAVEMAKIAQMRGEHPEIKTLANAIIASQDIEIGQMKGYRKAWYGSDATPPMDKMPMLAGMSDASMTSMMNMMKDMDGLKTATPFDKAFIMAMLPHHQSAVEAAKLAQQKATKPEIKTLAGSIIADQQREIDQMNGWLKAWYGVSAGADAMPQTVNALVVVPATATAAAAATIIAAAGQQGVSNAATAAPMVNAAAATATAQAVRAPTMPADHAGHGG